MISQTAGKPVGKPIQILADTKLDLRAAKADFPAMFARGGKLLVVFALVFSTGAHWAALQTVAWTTMLAKNLCTRSVSEAVSNTFDGEHPCPLCKAIAAAKKSQKKSDAVAPVMKMEFPPLAGKIILFPPAQFEILPLHDTFANSVFFQPPSPPPRGALA